MSYVPEYNSEQILKVVKFIGELKNKVNVRVLPYHDYARTKYSAFDMENTPLGSLTTKEEIEGLENMIQVYRLKVM